ncbi:hypothetical protein [Pseudomonas laurylsulfatiphila]|uniref:hypothetical protein n=1 Tax=Pseudomonas laurylsulfatiphila TaxID=2011015 RepID=UPI003D1CD08F
MVVNDNACEPDERGALESIAGKPAPTVSRAAAFALSDRDPSGRQHCAVKSAPYPPRQPAGWSTGVRSA